MVQLNGDTGPFDIIGDVHGCVDELVRLLARLGYEVPGVGADDAGVRFPAGRRAVFLGDIVNRGPDTPGVLRLVMGMVASGQALCIAGNHDVLLQRRLEGSDVDWEEALTESLAQLEETSEAFRRDVATFLRERPAYLSLDGGRLIVAHAGLPEEYHGRTSPEALDFAVNGRRTKEMDENGREVRYRWARDYGGAALVVYGHYSQEAPDWLNGTVCIDTGCVYGGRLTALRYPERELVSVVAERVYKTSRRSERIRAAALASGA